MKVHSTSLAFRKTQIKNAMRYHYTSITIAKIKNNNTPKCWRGMQVNWITRTLLVEM